MTDDETPTGAPLRQQIAEAIHKESLDHWAVCDEDPEVIIGGAPCCGASSIDLRAADAVVALLNLTPVARNVDDTGVEVLTSWPPGETLYRVGLPSTPPDTSSEPA